MKIHCIIWDIKNEGFYTLESPWSDQALEDVGFYVIERFDTYEKSKIGRLKNIIEFYYLEKQHYEEIGEADGFAYDFKAYYETWYNGKYNDAICYCGNPVDITNPDCITYNLCEEHSQDV